MAALIALPDDPRPAIEIFIGYATGMVTDVLEVAHAGLHFSCYGLGLVHKDAPKLNEEFSKLMSSAGESAELDPNLPQDLKGCCDEIAKLCPDCDPSNKRKPKKAIDWATLLPQLIPLVLQLLKIVLPVLGKPKAEPRAEAV